MKINFYQKLLTMGPQTYEVQEFSLLFRLPSLLSKNAQMTDTSLTLISDRKPYPDAY